MPKKKSARSNLYATLFRRSRALWKQSARAVFPGPILKAILPLAALAAILAGAAPLSPVVDRESGAALYECAAASVQAFAGALAPMDADISDRPAQESFPAVRAADGESGGNAGRALFTSSQTVAFKRNPAADGEYAFTRMLVRSLSPLCRIACG